MQSYEKYLNPQKYFANYQKNHKLCNANAKRKCAQFNWKHDSLAVCPTIPAIYAALSEMSVRRQAFLH